MEEFLIILVINITLAIADGAYDEGNKKMSKLIEMVGIFMVFFLGYTTQTPIYLIAISGILIRFAVFNISYNLTRGLGLDYIGDTDYIDLLVKKVNPAILPIWYLVSLCLGFGLLYNYV